MKFIDFTLLFLLILLTTPKSKKTPSKKKKIALKTNKNRVQRCKSEGPFPDLDP